MKDSIFHTTVEMPPKSNSPEVVRTAQTMGEMHRNYMPAAMPNDDAEVKNLQRPRRGHGY